MSHTPGPWHADIEFCVRDAADDEICHMAIVAQLFEAGDNAHLIAAAPDLLRLLTWAVDTLRARSPEVLGMHPEGSEAAALIAKLTGEA